MIFNTDYRVEDYILNSQWDQMPQHIKERAVVCGIDLIMALIVGSKGNQFAVGNKVASSMIAKGDVSVLGSKEKYNILGATIAMSHASNSFDIDDGHNMIKGHPGTSFIAGILAAAIEKKATYKEFLTTLIVVYETSIRWALATQNHYNYLHSTGAYGAYGTAAGIARLYNLSKEQLNNALSIADFHAPMTPVMRSVEYPSMNKDGVPFGALVGAMSIIETLAGSTGYGNLLETPEYQSYVDSLGQQFEIMNLYFKPYTCCRWAHQPIKACIDLMNEHGFKSEDIQKATINTFDSAAKLSKKIPRTADEAQYNIAWPVASALVCGDVGYNQVCELALGNHEVIAMMDRLEFVMDPEMDKQFPQKRLAWVHIELKDGTSYTSEIYAAPGEHTDMVDIHWMTEKFLRITKPMLNTEEQKKILTMLTEDLNTPVTEVVNSINNYLLK
ncbi:MmgE/PrpD family protein [Oscillospiraceae bacterium LTW-04]|nr:MmgE/PrpD family protein [Oscillospiraceae bacterium MB24-C1]